MVANTGEALRTGAVKPVNTPELIHVDEDPTGLPVSLRAKGKLVVVAIEDRWRLDDEWWRCEAISRTYYAVRLAAGFRLVIYKDLLTDKWYRQTY